MIVVTIIGILAAIAIPAYQDYLIKTKVMEITRFSGATKIYIWEEYFTKGQMPGTTSQAATTAEQMIMAAELVTTADYSRIHANQSTLEVKLSALSGVGLDKTIVYTFATDGESITLDCKGGNLPDKYRSPSCKSN